MVPWKGRNGSYLPRRKDKPALNIGPAARSTRPDRTSVSMSVDKAKRAEPPLGSAERLSPLRETRRAFLPHPCQDDPRKMPEAVVAKARGRTGMESDSDLIQTALANLTLPDYFPDWMFSQNSMADAQRDGFPLPSATRSVRTDSVLRGIRVGSLKPIEHLILDDFISEVMVNGGDRVFIEKAGYLNILGRFIPEDERILLIEDTAEIQLSHANLVRFEARRPDNGVPGIAMRDLLKATLRHRPDRILLGEIRGGEAFGSLQPLKTGPAGALSSIHAHFAKDGLVRFSRFGLEKRGQHAS